MTKRVSYLFALQRNPGAQKCAALRGICERQPNMASERCTERQDMIDVRLRQDSPVIAKEYRCRQVRTAEVLSKVHAARYE